MIDFITKSVNSRTITAFFDTREAAQSATDSLVSLGVLSHQIQMTKGSSDLDSAGTTHPAEMSFWESLKSIFLPAEDHHSYPEGLRRGGARTQVDPLAGRGFAGDEGQGASDALGGVAAAPVAPAPLAVFSAGFSNNPSRRFAEIAERGDLNPLR